MSDRLFAAGALDVFLTPAQMKKGRPGTLVTVLAPPGKREAVCDVLFRETTTLGVRFQGMWREDARPAVGRGGGDRRDRCASRSPAAAAWSLNAVPGVRRLRPRGAGAPAGR